MTNPTQQNTKTSPKRAGGARVAMLVGAAVASLLAAGALGLGALALWGDDQKDDRGYISTDSERFATHAAALATENLDVDLDGTQELVEATGFGDIRVEATSPTGEPVFVGIARTDDVAAYLAGAPHSTVEDINYEPFEASYRHQPGVRGPAAPGSERIWAASAQGTGTQTLEWEAEDGDWSVVVMNADGSRGVQADVSAGVKLPFLDELGWSAIGSGTLLLLTAAGLLVLSLRARR
jgi:hypothetical protein